MYVLIRIRDLELIDQHDLLDLELRARLSKDGKREREKIKIMFMKDQMSNSLLFHLYIIYHLSSLFFSLCSSFCFRFFKDRTGES